MADKTRPQQTEPTNINQPGWTVSTVHQTIINHPSPASEELTPEQLAEIETRYRAQVAERYNRLSLTGLPERDPACTTFRWSTFSSNSTPKSCRAVCWTDLSVPSGSGSNEN